MPARDPARHRAVARKWRAANPDKVRAAHRRAYERQKARMEVDPEYHAKIMEQRRRNAERRNARLRESASRGDAAHQKLLAKKQKWRDEHRDKTHEYEHRARERQKERMASDPEYREKIARQRRDNCRRQRTAIAADPERKAAYLARDNESHKARRRADPEVRAKEQATARRNYAKYSARMMVDARFYADLRAANRKRNAKRTVLAGKTYWPHFGNRVPDWSVRGQDVVDARSPFLRENLSASQIAWLKEKRLEERGKEA